MHPANSPLTINTTTPAPEARTVIEFGRLTLPRPKRVPTWASVVMVTLWAVLLIAAAGYFQMQYRASPPWPIPERSFAGAARIAIPFINAVVPWGNSTGRLDFEQGSSVTLNAGAIVDVKTADDDSTRYVSVHRGTFVGETRDISKPWTLLLGDQLVGICANRFSATLDRKGGRVDILSAGRLVVDEDGKLATVAEAKVLADQATPPIQMVEGSEPFERCQVALALTFVPNEQGRRVVSRHFTLQHGR
jgi:hypothetical protein